MTIAWQDMARHQQQVQRLTRCLLPPQTGLLTASECELLAWLYFVPAHNTPALLSQASGMKKEAVSRSLKRLAEKGCIRREKLAADERRVALFLTEKGQNELQRSYEAILQPFYDLWRRAGVDFERFLADVDVLAAHLSAEEEEKHGAL